MARPKAALSVFLLIAGSASSQPVSPTCATQGLGVGCTNTGDTVNVRLFGAKGDGITDDTAAIQAAIDYATARNLQTIFCPSGRYKISPNGNAMIYLDPPGNLRSNWSNPSTFSFSLAFVGEREGIGNYQGRGIGCQLWPTTNRGVAFIVGPGQGMVVKGIEIAGPNDGSPASYRANLPPNGVGLGIAGGNGGASSTVIENVRVDNFYTLYETGANGACCIADGNTFRKIDGSNARYGLYFLSGQNDINDMSGSRFNYVNTAIWSGTSRQLTVTGGNFSAVNGVSAAFGISGTSAFSKTADGNGLDYTFTTKIVSPDGYIGNVYNAFMMMTDHFGIVPMTMARWKPGTSVAMFQIVPAWVFSNFGTADLTSTTDLEAEISAANKIYAAEQVQVVEGLGVSLEGIHVESVACQKLYRAAMGFGGATRQSIKNIFFNADPSLAGLATGTDAQKALFYCTQTFPFIQQGSGGASAHLDIDGGDFAQQNSSAPLLIEQGPHRFLSARNLAQVVGFNERIWDNGGYSFSELPSSYQIETVPNGAGEWDSWYSPPPITYGTYSNMKQIMLHSHLTAPFYGYRYAPGQIPNLTPDVYALVSGALGALGTYPPIDCETVYRSVGWNSVDVSHIHLRSASCPGYSWGQSLTDALVGETVTWSYKGGSAMLYLDAKTRSWMFPGLGFKLSGGTGDGSGGKHTYVVTGVFPQLGYISAFDTAGSALPGTKTTVYSCSSSCIIGQAAYSWTAY